MAVRLNLDQQSLANAKSALDGVKNGLPRAISRALNSTFTGVRTDMVALVRDDYTMKASAIRKRITIKKSTFSNLTGHVESSGPLPNLTDFTGTNQTKKGVTVNVKKSSGRQLLPGFFIQRSRSSGKLIVLGRPINPATGRRYPRYGPGGSGGSGKFGGGQNARLLVRYGPHPEILLNTKDNWATLQGKARVRLDNNFGKEVNAILQGYAK